MNKVPGRAALEDPDPVNPWLKTPAFLLKTPVVAFMVLVAAWGVGSELFLGSGEPPARIAFVALVAARLAWLWRRENR